MPACSLQLLSASLPWVSPRGYVVVGSYASRHAECRGIPRCRQRVERQKPQKKPCSSAIDGPDACRKCETTAAAAANRLGQPLVAKYGQAKPVARRTCSAAQKNPPWAGFLRLPGSRFRNGGQGRNRTGVRGFAVRCMTTLPPGHCLVHRDHDDRRLPLKNKTPVGRGSACKLERETRLELATPTLARSCSTN